MSKKTMTLDEEAAQLSDAIREGFVSVEKMLTRFVEIDGHSRLGYDTFDGWWMDCMDGITLTSAMKPRLVYTLLETKSPEWIGENVTGVSKEYAEQAKRQKDLGIPADLASVRVNTYVRRPPTAPATIHITVTPEEYAMWNAIVGVQQTEIGDYAGGVLRDHFSRKISAVLKAAA